MSTTSTTVVPVLERKQLTLPAVGGSGEKKPEEEYRYKHLLPHFSDDRYPPLEPFEHVDPAFRALKLPNPRAFLDGAESVIEITPHLGTEVRGVNLAQMDSDSRDQLALEARMSGFVMDCCVAHWFLGRPPWSDGFPKPARVYRQWTRLLLGMGSPLWTVRAGVSPENPGSCMLSLSLL